MRRIITLFCSFLLLATLLGLAHPGGSSRGAYTDALYAVPLAPDILCAEGTGHGTCQVVAAGEPSPINLSAAAGSSQFQITAVTVPGRTFAPDIPPPRHFF